LKKDEFVNSFPKFVLFLYYRRFEELKNYSNELESNIANLLKIRAVSLKEAGGPRENHRPVIIH
jgi:hypothetical protein